MDKETALAAVRAAYAREILAIVGVTDPAVEAAFATVPREAFLGPGPWQRCKFAAGYEPTPSDDPVHLYNNSLFGIVPERGLNNGQPSLHAWLLSQAVPRPGEHAVHVGAGVGYYTALMAHMVGPQGRVTGIEFDPDLAARAKANFTAWPNVEIKQGDGALCLFDPADVIYVNAGATRPAPAWLDGLKDGGRLILPLTTKRTVAGDTTGAGNVGAVFRIVRHGDSYAAKWISPVAIFPCAGNRDEASEIALAAGLAKTETTEVTRLRRDPHAQERTCCAHGDGWCFAL